MTRLLDELLQAQRAFNVWYANASTAERYASSCATLRHIAEVEDDAPTWYADAGLTTPEREFTAQERKRIERRAEDLLKNIGVPPTDPIL